MTGIFHSCIGRYDPSKGPLRRIRILAPKSEEVRWLVDELHQLGLPAEDLLLCLPRVSERSQGCPDGGWVTNDTEGYALPDETQTHFQTECTSYRNVSEFSSP